MEAEFYNVDVSRHTCAATEAIEELEPKTRLSVGNWQVKNLKKTRIKEINKLSKV